MAEEKYIDPKAGVRKVVSRAQQAAVRASKISQRDLVMRRRKNRQREAAAHATELAPEGIPLKLKARIMAAHRRHEESPETVAMLERAQTARRVQVAKREAGITDQGPPAKFMGMDQAEWEREVNNTLPPPIKLVREKAKAKK